VYVVFFVLFLFLVVSTSAVNCLERLVSDMIHLYVRWDIIAYTLIHSKSSKTLLQFLI